MSQLPRLRSGLFFDRALTRRSLLFFNVPEAAALQPVHYLFQLQSPRAHSLMNPDIDNIIRQNFKDAQAAGFGQMGQTVLAVQAVQLARPDMTPADALAAVKLVQQE